MAESLEDIWKEEHPAQEFSWWKPFPPITTSSCTYCPPSRLDPFILRAARRGGLLILALPGKKLVFQRWPRLMNFAVWPALTFSALIEVVFLAGAGMKTFAILFLAGLVGLSLIVAPVLLEAKAGIKLEGAANVLFNVVLTVWSVVFSFLLTKPLADKSARARWLPFAENACNSLITIACSAERMRRLQRMQCGDVIKTIDPRKLDGLKPILAVFDARCREGGEKLAALRDQIRDARKGWESFIRTHCDGLECAAIELRLRKSETDLNVAIDREVPIPSCEIDSLPHESRDRNNDPEQHEQQHPAQAAGLH